MAEPAQPIESPRALLPADVLRGIVEAMPVAAFVIRDGVFVEVNERCCTVLGRPRAEVLGREAFGFLPAGERERIRARHQQRNQGERVPDDYELLAARPDGSPLPLRLRISPFPLAGERALLTVMLRERTHGPLLIRGLSDAAAAAQAQRSPQGVLSVARDRLVSLGLSPALLEVRGGKLHFLHAEGPFAPIAGELARQHPSGIPEDALGPLSGALHVPQGVLVDDLAPLLLGALPAGTVDPELRAMAAGVPVDGAPHWLVLASGRDLDPSVAGAFGLFGKQLGATLETQRRLEELARINRELMTVNHVARASATLGSGRALQSALERLAVSVGADSIALFRREDDELLLTAHEGFPEEWVTRSHRTPVAHGTPWGEAAALGEPVTFEQPRGAGPSGPRLPVPTPPHGMTRLGAQRARPQPNAAAVPLQVSERVQGVLVAVRHAGALNRDDLRLLTTLAAQLAVSLQNTLLFQQTQRRVTELSLLLELGQAVLGSLDSNEVLAAGARVAARVLRCSAAYVFLPDDEARVLRCAALEDPAADLRMQGALDVPLDRPSMTALAFRSGRAQSSFDSPADPRIDPALTERFGCRATLAIPLLSHDRALGVLLLVERDSERAFDPQDVRLASHAAQLLAASVENAALYEEQRRRAEEMTLLNEVSRTLAGSLELQPLLDTAAETLRKLADASNCFVLLWEPREAALVWRAGPPEHRALMSRFRLRLDQTSLAVTALREKRPVQVTDAASSDSVHRGLVEALHERSVLAVPMLARDEALGVVVVDDTRRPRVFTPFEVERFRAVAGQLALAVLSARLYEDLRRSYAELARAQAELIDRERLAALGELSASVAHEVRNPLGVIVNALGTLKRILRPTGETGFLIDVIGEEADRLNRMVGDLLDYSRPLQPALQPLLLRPLVQAALDSARPNPEGSTPPPPVEVHVDISEELTVRADARLFRQALINLFLNAWQAMPRGGSLRVRATTEVAEGRTLARLSIRDTGPGVPEEIRPRIFQAFFTTKATGTGLGLAVVRRIVEGHGGRVAVGEPRPGDHADGAEFLVWLPVEQE